jgi:hypothetical protein
MKDNKTHIGWGSDFHWEYWKPGIRDNKIIDFCERINKEYDIFISCGDNADSRFLKEVLEKIGQHAKIPFYFLLGNHDYYHSFTEHVDNLVVHLSATRKIGKCIYGPISNGLVVNSEGEKVKLVFCNGFANGEPYTDILVNDENFISDFHESRKEDWYNLRLDLSCKSVIDLKKQLVGIKDISEVYIFTHIPPFPEACFYDDKPTTKEYLPFFCDKYLGLFLKDFQKIHPELKIKVFCGHTHTKTHYVNKNLEVFVSNGDYGQIFINDIIL